MNRFQGNQRNNRFQKFQWIFKREPHTVWCTSIIKSPDFNDIKEITDFSEITDSKEIQKRYLPILTNFSQKKPHTIWCV